MMRSTVATMPFSYVEVTKAKQSWARDHISTTEEVAMRGLGTEVGGDVGSGVGGAVGGGVVRVDVGGIRVMFGVGRYGMVGPG